MAEKTYYANWILEHDGQTFERGDAVKMDEKTAAPMLGGVLSTKKPSDDIAEEADGDAQAKITALEAQVKDLETKLNSANAKLAQGNKAELVEKISALEAQVKDLETKLAAAKP